MPPQSAVRVAEIEAESAAARAERERRYTAWRQETEDEMTKLEEVIRGVIHWAPEGSMVRGRARCGLEALERVREEEANVAMRDRVQLQAMVRDVHEAADAARVHPKPSWPTCLISS